MTAEQLKQTAADPGGPFRPRDFELAKQFMEHYSSFLRSNDLSTGEIAGYLAACANVDPRSGLTHLPLRTQIRYFRELLSEDSPDGPFLTSEVTAKSDETTEETECRQKFIEIIDSET